MSLPIRTSDQSAGLSRKYRDGLTLLGWGLAQVVPDESLDELVNRFRVGLGDNFQLDSFGGDFESSFPRL
jgi:hypothetical protein